MWPFNKQNKINNTYQLKKGDLVTSNLNLFYGKEMVLKVRKVNWIGMSYNEGDAITISNYNGELWAKYLSKC